MTTPADLPRFNPLPTPTVADRLHLARRCARKSLQFLAGWLKAAHAPEAEIEALRAAWKAIPPPT